MVINEGGATPMTSEVTVLVPMNIALVKYWGKRDEQLILPLNDSISLTVDRLTATTTIRMIVGAGEHTIEINGRHVELSSNKRYKTVFNEALRLLRKRKEKGPEKNGNEPLPPVSFHFQVISTTNFPVAAGLASSAAGFAAIALALQHLLKLDDAQANRLARIGSGSACRSMFGGLVHWQKGEKADGMDCVAVRIGTSTWPDLFCVILVFDDGRKKVGSSEGMRRTAATSTLLKRRVEEIVPERIEEIKKAFVARDFEALAKVIMTDSNQFHAVCLDSSPPIRYLNEASWHLMDTVEQFNRDTIRAAYTFDAGPNACVIVQKKDLISFVNHAAKSIKFPAEDVKMIGDELGKHLDPPTDIPSQFVCSKLIVSKMGGGPQNSVI
ncbi:unnamed protein product [Caenorhabditis sp. 36 PRJEB53466]|nr:unnamed protein product [Caenorhabditis sp. 36 PRJEB53466]